MEQPSPPTTILDLIRDAAPFSLKLIESLLAESPQRRGLLLATAIGFTQYGYAFVQHDADELGGKDLAAATALRVRARTLFLALAPMACIGWG